VEQGRYSVSVVVDLLGILSLSSEAQEPSLCLRRRMIGMGFSFKAIDHIQLAGPKGCEEDARRFYKEILGFQEVDKPEELKKRGGVWFTYGTVQLHIGIEEPFIPAKKAHPAFEIENIEELINHLRNSGVDVIEDSNLPGAQRMYVTDPMGNRIELLEWR